VYVVIIYALYLGQVVLLLLRMHTFCKLSHLPCYKVFMALAECFMSPVCGVRVMLCVWTAGSMSNSQPSRDQHVLRDTSSPPLPPRMWITAPYVWRSAAFLRGWNSPSYWSPALGCSENCCDTTLVGIGQMACFCARRRV
jgi:hypothetical protein